MLESLINPRKAEKKPSNLFFVGLLYASLSVALVNLIFSKDVILFSHSSLLIITFTTMFSIPFMYFLIRFEEIKEMIRGKGITLFAEHFKAIAALLWLFLGFVVAFSFWYAILPQNIASNNFHSQIQKYCQINPSSEGCRASSITAKIIGAGNVYEILKNNIYVLIFVLIFSLVFGAGAIFILAWNASVIAVAMGTTFVSLNFGILFSYLLHGLPEIAAYFFAALAGGIAGAAIIKGNFVKGKRLNVILDFMLLIIISSALLLLAALLEVYVSPLFV